MFCLQIHARAECTMNEKFCILHEAPVSKSRTLSLPKQNKTNPILKTLYCDLRSSLRRAVSKRTFYVSKRTFAVSKRAFAVSERIVFPRACHVWAMKLTCFRG